LFNKYINKTLFKYNRVQINVQITFLLVILYNLSHSMECITKEPNPYPFPWARAMQALISVCLGVVIGLFIATIVDDYMSNNKPKY